MITQKYNNDALKYQGEVTTTIKQNDVILSKKVFHNKGYKTLFRFLCECLAGDYADADKYRPMRIKLFYYDENFTPAEARKRFEEEGNFEQNITALSGAITTDTRAKVEQSSDGKSYNVTFHFIVPFTFIGNSVKKINQIMLYSSSRGSIWSNGGTPNTRGLLAYYLCTGIAGDHTEYWDAIDLTEVSEHENTNLIIEWTMSITNIN